MRKLTLLMLAVVCLLLLLVAMVGAGVALAAPDSAEIAYSANAYADFTPYEQIKPALDEIANASDRVHYEVTGRSAEGRELYLVIVAMPEVYANIDAQHDFRDLMLSDPTAAQARLRTEAIKEPVFINCSIHGNEPNGTDAGLRLIRRLAYADLSMDSEAREILDNCIVLLNICQNPDGRVHDVRSNGNGFDMNRDFLTQSQPEVRSTAAQIARWLPAMFYDLHGYYNPMRIDPCTPPHNPNYEYDLYIKWSLPTAYAMRAAVTDHTNGNTSYPDQPGRHDVNIPYVDMQQGYEDYSPYYTPQFAMYYGALAFTMETFSRSDLGTDGDFWACWAGALYGARHRVDILSDQIEQFRRGITGFQRGDEAAPAVSFPEAYVIPTSAPLQRDPIQAARMVDYLITSGVRVNRATMSFTVGDVLYPAGTYVVSMKQPLRGLANVWLWNGEDVSYMTNSMYSVCATSLPQMLGFDRAVVWSSSLPAMVEVEGATWPGGGKPAAATTYVLPNDENNAVQAVNDLLADGATVKITTAATADLPAGTFLISGVSRDIVGDIGDANHLTFTPAKSVVRQTATLRAPRVAITSDSSTAFALRQLGFSFKSIGATSPLTGYDVVIGSSTSLSASSVKAYVKAGGTYVGVGYSGTNGPLGNLLPVTQNMSNTSESNALVRVAYNPAGVVGAYYAADDWAFLNRPVWFTRLGTGVRIDASYRSDPDWYICGYWRDRDAAAGKALVVSGDVGEGKVVYMGLAPTFRAYPEHTYRLLANAIWCSME
jgi:Zinc carboxypeptidase